MKLAKLLFLGVLISITFSGVSYGAVMTFNDLVTSSTSYSFDADNDGSPDAVFTTTDPGGFNTVGPGTNMTYIQEPGLEGTSLLSTDLRVDFLTKAKDYLKFGFALDSSSETKSANFKIYDSNGNLLGEQTVLGLFTKPDGVNNSSYPEGQISINFSGIAAYALFDFSSDYGRYIIDNFEGTYGTSEVPTVPEPATMLLLGFGLAGLAGVRRFRK